MKRMTGDKRGWAREKCRGRLDNEERERCERGDRWLLQREWQEVEGRQKKGWGSTLIFYTRQFLYTWREVSDSLLTLPFTLTLSFILCILLLLLADAALHHNGKPRLPIPAAIWNKKQTKKNFKLFNIWTLGVESCSFLPHSFSGCFPGCQGLNFSGLNQKGGGGMGKHE